MSDLSKRKMESYKRAEIVAQAARKLISARVIDQSQHTDILLQSLLDWMDVTGKVKYLDPQRRSKKDRTIKVPD